MDTANTLSQATVRPRGSVSSVPLARLRTESSSIIQRLRSDSESVGPGGGEIVHPVEPRARTAQLPPVMVCTPLSPSIPLHFLLRTFPTLASRLNFSAAPRQPKLVSPTY